MCVNDKTIINSLVVVNKQIDNLSSKTTHIYLI